MNLEYKPWGKLWEMGNLLPSVSFWHILFSYVCHICGSKCPQSLVVPVSMDMSLAWISKSCPVKEYQSWWWTLPSIFSYVLACWNNETYGGRITWQGRERVLQQKSKILSHLWSCSFTTWTLLTDLAHLTKFPCIWRSKANNRSCKIFLYKRQLFQVQTKR